MSSVKNILKYWKGECTASGGSNLEFGTWNSSMSLCFQILLVLDFGAGVSLGSSNETFLRLCFAFLLFVNGGCLEALLVGGASFSSRDSKEMSSASSP